ncbi:MAG: SDR family oxidoreductase [Oscillospiraceae bacterium]|jgi:3-oxoacyl-[acyl-carrier protein] reductase|nr:SDR family oxidoreductase [Oscillospiraceae bacterium]
MKAYLVTGGSRGIGAAVCRRLAARADDRVLCVYNKSRAAAEALAAQFPNITPIQADVTSPESIERAFSAVTELDGLALCAGEALSGLFQDMASRWRAHFDVNFGGAVSVLERAVPILVRQKSGSVVLVSSVHGVHGASCESIYSAGKSAIIGLGKSLAKELGPSGVRVNIAAPGWIDTDMTAAFSAEERRVFAQNETSLGRTGTADEAAEVIAFLLSDAASYMTGQVVEISG